MRMTAGMRTNTRADVSARAGSSSGGKCCMSGLRWSRQVNSRRPLRSAVRWIWGEIWRDLFTPVRRVTGAWSRCSARVDEGHLWTGWNTVSRCTGTTCPVCLTAILDTSQTRSSTKRNRLATCVANLLIFMAPRPGFEPGTYGLTEQHTVNFPSRKSMISNGFLEQTCGAAWQPNLFRTSMVGSAGWLSKFEANQRLAGDATDRKLNLGSGVTSFISRLTTVL